MLGRAFNISMSQAGVGAKSPGGEGAAAEGTTQAPPRIALAEEPGDWPVRVYCLCRTDTYHYFVLARRLIRRTKSPWLQASLSWRTDTMHVFVRIRITTQKIPMGEPVIGYSERRQAHAASFRIKAAVTRLVRGCSSTGMLLRGLRQHPK